MKEIAKAIRVLFVIITALLVSIAIPQIMSIRLSHKAEYLIENNNCVLEDSLDFRGLTSKKYKCDRNKRLELKINSYIKKSYYWGFFGFIFFLIVISIIIPLTQISLIYFVYKFVKWVYKQNKE